MLIDNFKSKKACDYLDTGCYSRVLIIFHHGLGDSVMFWSTCLKALERRYPTVSFAFCTHLGQEDIFGKVDDNPDHYDIAFKLAYPCSEWNARDETKSEKCAREELGLPSPLLEDYSLPVSFRSPLVGMHFNSTCCQSLNCPKDIARKLWNQVEEAGFIPIDTHMRHANDHASRSLVHDFEQCRRIDNVPATVEKLVGLLSSCRGFAGVPSGNMACALAVLKPRAVLYLSSQFPMRRLVRMNCFEMNVGKGYDRGVVKEWLEFLKNG